MAAFMSNSGNMIFVRIIGSTLGMPLPGIGRNTMQEFLMELI